MKTKKEPKAKPKAMAKAEEPPRKCWVGGCTSIPPCTKHPKEAPPQSSYEVKKG